VNQSIDPQQAALAILRLLPLLSQASDNTLNLVIEAIGAAIRVAGPIIDESTSNALFSALLTTQFESPQGDGLSSFFLCFCLIVALKE
jgi:hypothetical protein